MGNKLGPFRCSQCGAPLVDGELVGVDEQEGNPNVLCCLCLDLSTSRLGVVRHMNGQVEIRGPRLPDVPGVRVRPS